MAALNLSACISRTPRRLFAAYLSKRRLTLPGPLPSDEKPIVFGREVLRLIEQAGESVFRLVEADLDRCNVMSDHSGEDALFDVVDDNLNLRAALEELSDQRARALYMLIEHPGLFREAEFRGHSARLNTPKFSSRFRIERNGLVMPETAAINADDAFREALRRAHPQRRPVEVEAFQAVTRPTEFMVAIQTANATRGVNVYADGLFDVLPIQSASTTTVMLDAETGLIEVAGKYWQGPGRKGIAEAFVEHVLKMDLDLVTVQPTVFDLRALASGKELTVEPDDVVREVRVMEVRYRARSDPSVDQTWHSRLGRPILEAIAAEYGPGASEKMKTAEPEFVRLRFFAREGDRDPAISNFDLSLHKQGMANYSKNTRHHRNIAEKYLQRWGVLEEVAEALIDYETD